MILINSFILIQNPNFFIFFCLIRFIFKMHVYTAIIMKHHLHDHNARYFSHWLNKPPPPHIKITLTTHENHYFTHDLNKIRAISFHSQNFPQKSKNKVIRKKKKKKKKKKKNR